MQGKRNCQIVEVTAYVSQFVVLQVDPGFLGAASKILPREDRDAWPNG